MQIELQFKCLLVQLIGKQRSSGGCVFSSCKKGKRPECLILVEEKERERGKVSDSAGPLCEKESAVLKSNSISWNSIANCNATQHPWGFF